MSDPMILEPGVTDASWTYEQICELDDATLAREISLWEHDGREPPEPLMSWLTAQAADRWIRSIETAAGSKVAPAVDGFDEHNPWIDPKRIRVGDIVIRYDIRHNGVIVPVRHQCIAVADGVAPFKLQQSAGIGWHVDRPYGTHITDPEQMTRLERVRRILLRPAGFYDWDESDAADHRMRDLMEALCGPSEWESLTNGNWLGHDEMWETAAGMIDETGGLTEIQTSLGGWLTDRHPHVTVSNMIVKAMEELGEVSSAFHGRGDLADEAGQVVATLAALVGRFAPHRSLADAAADKAARLLVSQHPYAAGDWNPNQ